MGHEHFNKSLTLDLENRLMLYMMSVDRVKKFIICGEILRIGITRILEVDNIFHMMWSKLHWNNKYLFPSESSIKDSAVFKASPLHKLTSDQEQIKEIIIERVFEALSSNKKNQLIFIDGEAGTEKLFSTAVPFMNYLLKQRTRNENLLAVI